MNAYIVQLAVICLLGVSVTLGGVAKSLAVSSVDRANIREVVPVPTSVTVDLRKGETSSLPAGVTWHSSLTSGSSDCACDSQGVLKLTFSSPNRVRAEINMTFEDPSGWTFHAADSRSNNGYGGDGNHQDNDAEMYVYGKSIVFWGKDNVAASPVTSYGEVYSRPNFVANDLFNTGTLKVNIKDELATADNGLEYIHVDSYKLFALNGQADSKGVNYDVYLGLNRVVAGAYRSGTGLCKVSVKFYSS